MINFINSVPRTTVIVLYEYVLSAVCVDVIKIPGSKFFTE